MAAGTSRGCASFCWRYGAIERVCSVAASLNGSNLKKMRGHSKIRAERWLLPVTIHTMSMTIDPQTCTRPWEAASQFGWAWNRPGRYCAGNSSLLCTQFFCIGVVAWEGKWLSKLLVNLHHSPNAALIHNNTHFIRHRPRSASQSTGCRCRASLFRGCGATRRRSSWASPPRCVCMCVCARIRYACAQCSQIGSIRAVLFLLLRCPLVLFLLSVDQVANCYTEHVVNATVCSRLVFTFHSHGRNAGRGPFRSAAAGTGRRIRVPDQELQSDVR
jgi:hypothetical protein